MKLTAIVLKMRWYNVKSCFRGLMDKALASEASHVGSSPTGNIIV